MEKYQRNERISIILSMLSDSPGKVFSLGSFTDLFGSAKSSISEDIEIIRNTLEKFGNGFIETISGASGGVRYIPLTSSEKIADTTQSLCAELSKKERILTGGYIYTLDVIYNPKIVSSIAKIFSNRFSQNTIDYVITVETKGIPLAFSTARYIGVPLIIVRHYNEASDGASVNISYVSGSSQKVQTMVLPLKSLKRNSKLLFIDDFMKGGGTAKGILELANEFECEVSGIGVFVQTAEPVKKLVENYFSVLTLNNIDTENAIIDIVPSKN